MPVDFSFSQIISLETMQGISFYVALFQEKLMNLLMQMLMYFSAIGLTPQMQTWQSIEADIKRGYGEKNSRAVMSPVCPIKRPSILLISKS
jgi:hypothetical protein